MFVLTFPDFTMVHWSGINLTKVWIITLTLRYINCFLVIRDTTFECDETSGSGRFRKVALSDEDKLSLLENQGGHLLRTYMARDHVSAYRNFRNILPANVNTPRQFEERSLDSFDDRLDVKNTIVHLLQELRQERELNDQNEHIRKKSEYQRNSPYDRNDEKQNYIYKVGGKRGYSFANRQLSLRDILRQRRSDEAPSEETPAESNNTSAARLPFVLPQEVGIENVMTVTNTGVEEEYEYCLVRGTEEDGYLHMCTTCAVTTKLPDNYWPRFINEAVCNESDNGCFFPTGTAPHGRCKQTKMLKEVLRKTDGMCSLALKDGDIVIVDVWQITTYPFRVGCECRISSSSPYSIYV